MSMAGSERPRAGVPGARRAAPVLLAVALATLAGCAARTAAPVPLDTRLAAPRLSWIRSDAQALASAARVMTHDLRCPPVQATLHLFRDEAAFEAGLIARGAPPALAREAARTMTAVSSHRVVLANERRLNRLPWASRTFVLAHELGHVLQYELADGVRGRSEQWLREGFAEWIAMRVVSRLGGLPFTRLAAARARTVAGWPGPMPPLVSLGSFTDWARATDGPRSPPLTELVTLAVIDLIETYGLDALLQYFRASAAPSDAESDFRDAFGVTRAAFDARMATRYGAGR